MAEGDSQNRMVSEKEIIEWRAETKNEFKWIKKELGSVAKDQKLIAKSVSSNETGIKVLTTKVTLYAAAAGTIAGLGATIAIIILQTLLKN